MIKAIETIYNGYRFRSRLEARWAVFFDSLSIKYEYEPEGFMFDDGECYLPDFWLSFSHDDFLFSKYDNPGYFIEIKPNRPLKLDEIIKLNKLEEQTHHHSYFFCGVPGDQNIYFSNGKTYPYKENKDFELFVTLAQIVPGIASDEDFLKATENSRQARFEYGETPIIQR